MKRTPFICVAFLLFILISCEKDPVYFGDKNVRSELSIESVTDTFNTDYSYVIQNAVSKDTIYKRYYTVPKDTIFKEDGKTIKEIRYDTTYYQGKRAKYVIMDTVLFPYQGNVITFRIKANCAWTAPSIYTKWDETASWIRNLKTSGVCDAVVKYDVKKAISLTNRKIVRTQYYCSSDSTVLIKVMVTQKKLNED